VSDQLTLHGRILSQDLNVDVKKIVGDGLFSATKVCQIQTDKISKSCEIYAGDCLIMSSNKVLETPKITAPVVHIQAADVELNSEINSPKVSVHANNSVEIEEGFKLDHPTDWIHLKVTAKNRVHLSAKAKLEDNTNAFVRSDFIRLDGHIKSDLTAIARENLLTTALIATDKLQLEAKTTLDLQGAIKAKEANLNSLSGDIKLNGSINADKLLQKDAHDFLRLL